MRRPEVLPDVLRPGLKIVFCGTRPGRASAARRAYYAGPGNKFWPTLYEVGLTPVQMRPGDFREVTRYGIGLSDMVKNTYGQDDDIDEGLVNAVATELKFRRARPHILAFNGKKAASLALGVPTGRLSYGRQARPFAGAIVYVLPSTSGLAGSFWDIRHWRALARTAERLNV